MLRLVREVVRCSVDVAGYYGGVAEAVHGDEANLGGANALCEQLHTV